VTREKCEDKKKPKKGRGAHQNRGSADGGYRTRNNVEEKRATKKREQGKRGTNKKQVEGVGGSQCGREKENPIRSRGAVPIMARVRKKKAPEDGDVQ